MSVTAPLWLAVAGMVAAGLIVAHLISTSVPQRDPFPTARFVPQGAPLTVLRTRRLTDLTLLLLRLLAVALLGLALAGAHVTREAPARVVLADVSRAVASMGEVRDSVLGIGESAVLLAFDSSARRMSLDSLTQLVESREPATGSALPRASLSSALVSLHRTLSDFPEGRETTELVLVSPFLREEIDSATADLLALWAGPVRLVRVQGADSAGRAALGSRNTSSPTSQDSAWARQGGALIVWPADLATSTLERRAAPDTVQGIAAGSDVVIGNFARTHQPREGRVMVTWLDGAPAATEMPLGAGCIREVAIPVDPVGDVALRESFRAIARRLSEPCGGAVDFTPVPLSALGARLPANSSNAAGRPTGNAKLQTPDAASVWLAMIAVAILVCEQIVRRRRATT